ncbi:hypothetical protein [Mariniphaga sediminis]|uniref:hypothetical protein n=1 Tax=Mariniphaga sediminis TaxID=1628158 RepID=UPI00356A2C66
MKTKQSTIYECEFCGKYYKRKHYAEYHEGMCPKNPYNQRACFGCSHLIKKDAKVWIGIDNYYSGEPYYEQRTLLYCQKKQTFLYPPKAENKGNYFTEFYNEENENNPMPKECEFRKEDWE